MHVVKPNRTGQRKSRFVEGQQDTKKKEFSGLVIVGENIKGLLIASSILSITTMQRNAIYFVSLHFFSMDDFVSLKSVLLTLMALFLVRHLIKSFDVFLCLSVYFIEFFVSCHGLIGTDLENHCYLCCTDSIRFDGISNWMDGRTNESIQVQKACRKQKNVESNRD